MAGTERSSSSGRLGPRDEYRDLAGEVPAAGVTRCGRCGTKERTGELLFSRKQGRAWTVKPRDEGVVLSAQEKRIPHFHLWVEVQRGLRTRGCLGRALGTEELVRPVLSGPEANQSAVRMELPLPSAVWASPWRRRVPRRLSRRANSAQHRQQYTCPRSQLGQITKPCWHRGHCR